MSSSPPVVDEWISGGDGGSGGDGAPATFSKEGKKKRKGWGSQRRKKGGEREIEREEGRGGGGGAKIPLAVRPAWSSWGDHEEKLKSASIADFSSLGPITGPNSDPYTGIILCRITLASEGEAKTEKSYCYFLV